MSGDDDLSHLSLLELYREETRTQTRRCPSGCSRSNRANPIPSRSSMRAAHSLKGAARIVGVPLGVDIAGGWKSASSPRRPARSR